MSCDTEYLEKNSFWFFRKRGLRRFGLCAIVLMIFVQTVRKVMGDLTERKTPTLQNDIEYVPKISVRALLCFFLWLWLTNMFWELPEVSLLGTIRVFCSNAESRFGCSIFRTLCSVLWLFTSCIWDVLRYRILRKKQLLIFSETWSSSFWIVCNCFDDFRTNRPKNNGQSHRKENTNFAKWRWVRSKNICSSSALLFSLVVTKKYVLRTSWGLSTWNHTCFLFKCRVTFWLRYFSNAMFGTLALYLLRLRCLAIPNT